MRPNVKRITHYTGIHRSGKTTAAIKFAKENNHLFIPTNFSDITEVKGFDENPSEYKQELLVDRMCDIYLTILRRKSDKYVVLDRSLLDIIAYSIYYDLSSEHIIATWNRLENIYDLLFTNNNIPIHEFYSYVLANYARPEDVNKFRKLLEAFYLVRKLFYNYAQKKDYYL
jgi:hypothetical protein